MLLSKVGKRLLKIYLCQWLHTKSVSGLKQFYSLKLVFALDVYI